MKNLLNPFIISGYEGEKYFCDRVEETNSLHSLMFSKITILFLLIYMILSR